MKSLEVSLCRRLGVSRLALLSVVLLAVSSTANAQEPASVAWKKHPSAQDLITYYPDRARGADASGVAHMRCGVTPIGALEACSILDEQPIGQGFGDAALKLSRLYRAPRNTSVPPVDIVIDFPRPSGARP